MTTRVEINFCGLCLFVQGTDSAGAACLHVLLPVTEDMPSMGMRKHLPRVVYSLDYESEKNPPTSVNDGLVSNLERIIDLENTVIDWSGIAKNGSAVALPSELANITALSRFQVQQGEGQIDPKHFADSLPDGDKCAARITLPANVQVSPYNFADLQVQVVNSTGSTETKPVRVAACAICVVETDAPTLPLGTLEKDLKPCAGMIRVTFGNMIAGDYAHPPKPFNPKDETHFRAFYDLMVKPPANPPIPKPKAITQSALGVDPITCMLAAGCVGADNC